MAAFSPSSLFRHQLTLMLDSSSPSSTSPITIVPDNYYSTIYSKISCICPFDDQERPRLSSEYFQSSAVSDHLNHQNLDQLSTKLSDLVVIGNNEEQGSSSFATNKNSITQKKDTSMEKKRKSNMGSSSKSTTSKDKKQKKVKLCQETKKKSANEDKSSTGYIHVRAKRGQATDSHSLAERVRRKKINERMKLLQALVPGCEKVTGKALMLDEIINYVQSLQNQVEFLSMKLASVNPILYDFGMDFESFMVRPDQDLNSLPSPLQSMQQCSLTLPDNHYPIFMDK